MSDNLEAINEDQISREPARWAAHLFSEWGPDATLFVGGLVFDCKRSRDWVGEMFWRAVQQAIGDLIEDSWKHVRESNPLQSHTVN